MRTGNSFNTDAAPLHGRELSVSYLEHGVDATEDRLLLNVWQPDTAGPVHSYEVYRDGPGWKQLWAGLNGGPTQMAAAVQWWHAQQSTAPYAGYRILAAIDGYGQITRRQLEHDLGLDNGALDSDGLYPRTLAALIEHGMVETRPSRSYSATATADEVLRPEDPGTMRQFAEMLDALDEATPAADPARLSEPPAPDGYLSQPIDYTHWAYFADQRSADACAAEFVRDLGCRVEVDPPYDKESNWLVSASRQILPGELTKRHDEAQRIVERHGGVYDGGEPAPPQALPGTHPASAAFPVPPQPGTATTAWTSTPSTVTPATSTATVRRSR